MQLKDKWRNLVKFKHVGRSGTQQRRAASTRYARCSLAPELEQHLKGRLFS